MNIRPICHRGWWLNSIEQNTEQAFHRAFKAGLGVETDLRDYCGQIVISHDLATSECMSFRHFLDIYCSYKTQPVLALNIKSDGLYGLLKSELEEMGVANYFVFDMSVPDLLIYRKHEMKYFTRISEFEDSPSAYEAAEGVWLDQFESNWVNCEEICRHLDAGKIPCIVSPELHHREYKNAWDDYKDLEVMCSDKDAIAYICTDFPQELQAFFNLPPVRSR